MPVIRLPSCISAPPAAVNTLHPGVVNTELARWLLPEQAAWWQTPLLNISKAFALTPEQGAQVRGAGRTGCR